MYYSGKRCDISKVKQREDKHTRFDYGKVRVDLSSALVGENEKIKDSR
ncbi:hypothetical protein [Fonticella tunisiensis]|uniref:Uncharacterized protein n=1 Tax=Fonticella tunisiensis TaxID=1096341 RepID=A0A4R7K9M0_9CLOT|nr:hypothetical protein [Fonticella tunisiensis]TDT50799.1 hypothetical protein EDD71_12411 [Fonticella tunisiensis]